MDPHLALNYQTACLRFVLPTPPDVANQSYVPATLCPLHSLQHYELTLCACKIVLPTGTREAAILEARLLLLAERAAGALEGLAALASRTHEAMGTWVSAIVCKCT